MSSKIKIVLIGALFLLPSLFFYFVSEDLNFALHLNELTFLQSLKNIWIPTNDFIHQSGLIRPIVSSINLIDYSLWGLNPFGYHLTNTIFHLINILLVYIFSIQIFNNKKLSFFCSFIFLFHPIIANSVYWISGRTDIIACTFYLISSIMLNKFISHKKNIYLILSSSSFLSALLSKEIAITLPLIHIWQIIYQFYIKKRSINLINVIKKVFLIDLMIISIFFMYRFLILGKNLFVINDIYNMDSFYHLLINIIKISSFLIIPFGHENFELYVYQYKFGLIWLLIPLLLALIFLLIKKNNVTSIDLFLLTLIILVSLPLLKLTMRWYMYIPTIPFAMLFSYFVYSRWNKTIFFKIIIIIYCIAMGYGSIKQYGIWHSNSKINSSLVNELVSKIYIENEIDTFIILNFPTKINRTSTFVAGFEELIQLHIGDLGKTVIRLGNIVHQYDITPVDCIINNKKIEISILSDNSYFLLGDNKQKYGLENLKIKENIASESYDITIEKINKFGKVKRISVQLDDILKNEKTIFLYFDENLLTYYEIK